MRFFIDTAKVEDIKKANDMGVIDQRDCIHRRWTHQW